MEHIRLKCNEKCVPSRVCSHQLYFICAVCHGAEGELATECPGTILSPFELECILHGIADFKNGEWILKERRV